tara:strand:- start:27944 stop:29740 length:1797 start_codon:yes stop_codon:yes gene_type:complete
MSTHKKKSQSALVKLLSNLKQQRQLILSATTCSILNKILDLAPPVLIGLSVDVVAREESSWIASFGFISVPSQLGVIAFLSCLVWSAESFFEYLYGLLWRNLAQIAQHNLRIKAYKHLQNLEMSFFEEDSSGRLLAILNDDINQLERFLDQGANQILQLLITVFLVGGAMAFLAPGIALISFLPIPLILWGSINFQKSLAPRYREVRERAGDLSSRLNNNLGGIVTIKSFATEEWEVDRLTIDSNLYQKSNRKAIKLSAAFIPLIRFAILFAFIAILIIGGLQTWAGEIAIGTYSFLVFITQRLLWPLTTLGHILDDYQRSMASTNRVLDLLDTPIKIQSGEYNVNPKNVKGEIEFEKVNFEYIKGFPLIKDMSLKIKESSTIGIVGATGSGKSTLIKLLLRLYTINSGCIKIDSIPIEMYNLKDLRRSISLVSQEVYLFHGTVEENISYGTNLATKEQIIKAAEIAEASNFINQLPHGYNTLVGERGQKLSGGQRQRIAIARAILKNAPILILDEATASVDNETEAAIQRSLEKITKNRTTLIIAHRLSTVRNSDQIIVLDKGLIIEKGTHKSLLNSKGLYADLWKVQVGLKNNENN